MRWQQFMAWALCLLCIAAAPPRTQQLIKTLKSDPSFKLRANAARLLGKDTNKEAIDALLEALDDDHAVVRAMACNSASNFDDKRVLPALRYMAASDRDNNVKKAAEAALKAALASRATGAMVGKTPALSFNDVKSTKDEPRQAALRAALEKRAAARSSLGFVINAEGNGYATSGAVVCEEKKAAKPTVACKGNIVVSRMPGRIVLGSVGASGEASAPSLAVVEKAVIDALAKSLFDDMVDVINQDRVQNGEEELR